MQRIIKLLIVLSALVVGATSAGAYSSYVTSFNSTYPAAAATLGQCVLCHINPAGGGTRNGFGSDFAAAGHIFTAIESKDSDGDGYTNIAEITALTWPGDATSHPSTTTSDTTPPTVTAFSVPSTSASLTVSGISITATDNVSVTGYIIIESAIAPAASAAGWSATAPTSYSATAAGAHTLYAYAKDAAGNVSASRSASVTITVSTSSDTIAPTVTGLAISSVTVSLSGFTATDNVGVVGYMVTESSTAPAATATGWSATAPTSYTFTTSGAKTLYAWAKDAAGNVSASRTAAITITFASDTTAPTVTAFTIPATSTSLTVPVTTFTATDNTGVTGYIITESATPPAASTAGWSAVAPSSYTATASGAHTLYAYARDAAGNVSASRSASVTITLASSDTTAPTVTAFTIPATATSLTVPVTSFTATDNTGVTGYIITGSATAPAASAAGWSAVAPSSYTATASGAHTLYAYAKDAAGNVSASRSASVTITLAASDTTAPTVTAFAIPATTHSLAIPINLFTASDNVGVTGYILTVSASTPSPTAAGWSATAPTSYTFTASGAKTLYAWAKDAAGNVSASRSASITISSSKPWHIGMFRSGEWYLDTTGNGIWDDLVNQIVGFGIPGDIPVVGDWNNVGSSSIGVFRSGTWYMKNLNGSTTDFNGIADRTVGYGLPGDVPVVGDWTGTGKTGIGVFRSGTWYLKNLTGTTSDNNGTADIVHSYGTAGDIPVVGDWTGDGKTKIGYFHPSTGTWYLNLPGAGTFVGCGAPGDVTKDACYTGTFGAAGDIPLVGDWNGDGKAQIGYYRPSTNYWYLDSVGDGAWHGCGPDTCYDGSLFGAFGLPIDIPVAGSW
jgi:hypothetical protein